MKIKKRLLAILCVSALALTGLTGCGPANSASGRPAGSTGASSAGAGSAPELDADQTLNLFFETPTTLDVNDVRNSSEFQVLTQVQEGLVRTFTDADGKEYTKPAGAESWTISDDKTVYTFKLRDQKWSDGKPVTAQNYVDSILRLLDPQKAFSYAFFAYDIKNAEDYYNGKAKASDVGVKALDDKTLQITLGKATPQFDKKLGFVALFPIRLDVIAKGGSSWATDYTAQVYNGPFIIKSWVKENSMVLEKNPNYWDAENVHLQTVNMTLVSEFSTQASLFESKQTDVIEGKSDYVKKWSDAAAKGEIQLKKGYLPQTEYLCLNQQTGGPSGLMKNAKVRQALSLAIDRDELVKLIYGRYYPAYGLIPYGIQVGTKSFRTDVSEPLKPLYDSYKGNDQKLQDLFKEGMQEAGVNKNPGDITLTLISTGTDAISKSETEYYQQTWQKKLGIKVKLNIGESSVFKEERNANRYDILMNGWYGDYNDPMTFVDMWTTNGGFSKFFGFYSNPAYDSLLKTLDGQSDNEKREKTYAELEKLLVADDAGVIPTYYGDSQYFVQNYVKNISFPLFGTPIEFSRAYISGKE